MIVRVNRHQLDYFRRKAITYKVEIYALLVGKRLSTHLVEVYQFKYPEAELATASEIIIDDHSYGLIEEFARADGHTVVGNIHSHINYAPVLSKTDHVMHIENNNKVTGICSVFGRRTMVNFWVADSSLPCGLEYFF